MSKSTGAEKGQAVDVANGEIVAQVEIGTGAIVGQIVGINENVGGSVRGVVDGMAVSIGKAQRQVTHGASRPDLQGMINGIRRVPKRVDVVEPRECGAYGRDTRNKSASNVQVECRSRSECRVRSRYGLSRGPWQYICIAQRPCTCALNYGWILSIIDETRVVESFAFPERILSRRHW